MPLQKNLGYVRVGITEKFRNEIPKFFVLINVFAFMACIVGAEINWVPFKLENFGPWSVHRLSYGKKNRIHSNSRALLFKTVTKKRFQKKNKCWFKSFQVMSESLRSMPFFLRRKLAGWQCRQCSAMKKWLTDKTTESGGIKFRDCRIVYAYFLGTLGCEFHSN